MRLYCILVLFFGTCEYFKGYAQDSNNSNSKATKLISGKVLNQNTSEPIAFVNIGFFEKNIGTVSDGKGRFALEVSSRFSSALLTISCVGFETKKMKASSFFSNKTQTILLNEKAIELDDVMVFGYKSKQYKILTLGVKKANSRTSGFINGKGSGAEIARLMLNKKRIKITSASIYIGQNVKSEFKLRLNVYSRKLSESTPHQNLMKTSQVVSSTIESGWLRINLDTPIITDTSFFISFEWLESDVRNPLIALKGNGIKGIVFQRSISLGKWVPSQDFNWAIQCEAVVLD